MKPSKPSQIQSQVDEQPDLIDIAQIFHKLSNTNRPSGLKPYSEYDPQSIFPPPSQMSVNNDNQSEKSKSNCLMNFFKRNAAVQIKEEKQIIFISKLQSHTKKVKKIEVEKVCISSINNKKHDHEQISNKESIFNKQQFPLHPPPTNFRITDFFISKCQFPKSGALNQENEQEKNQKQEKVQKKIQFFDRLQKISSGSKIEEQKSNTLVQSLVEKNNKKKKTIEQLKLELQSLKAHKQQARQKLNQTKQAQKQRLKQKLIETNERRLEFESFKSTMRIYLDQQCLSKQILPQVQLKLKGLQQFKKKGTNKRQNKKQTQTDEESIGNNGGTQVFTNSVNPQHIPDKRNYINQWVSKIEKFKEKVQNDKKYYHRLHKVNLKIQQVPFEVAEAFEKQIMLKDYVLYNVSYPFSTYSRSSEELIEINTFNTDQLRPEILTLLKYPKFSTTLLKGLIEKELQNLFKMSKKLHNSASFYFLQTTMTLQIGSNSQFVIFGRQKNQDFENLLDSFHKYQGFSQVMVRFIARVCLIALQQIKVKTDIPVFILPSNIYFSQKCDIKFTNILFNNIFLHKEFKSYLKNQNFHYFVCPEAFSQKQYSNLPVWSLGILMYYLIYEKYPFQYDMQASFLKQTFFIYNQLTFPTKPIINEKTKDFITTCLNGKQRDLNNLLKHPFFHK